MDTALLLHGWGGDSYENWLPWLQKELNAKMFDVFTPTLPNTYNPVLDEQKEYITVYSSDFKEGGYIIAHSVGSQLALKFIEENNIKDSIIILVAPTYTGLAPEIGREVLKDSYENLEKYFDSKIDFKKINKLNNTYHVFLSDDDPFINMENAKKYYSQLKNIEFREFKNKGHFNTKAGVVELEEILEYIR